MDAFLLLMIVVAAAIAGALEVVHIFDLLTGPRDDPRRPRRSSLPRLH